MRLFQLLSIVALFATSLNGVTWAGMGEMGSMKSADATPDTNSMKDMGTTMGDMSCMMKGMSRIMQHKPMRDETQMKHMGVMMNGMSGMAKEMSSSMGHGPAKDGAMPKDMDTLMNDMSAMMQHMSETMSNSATVNDENKMKHMSAMMRDMSGMMERMGDKMGSGTMMKDDVMKDDEMMKTMKQQMSDM